MPFSMAHAYTAPFFEVIVQPNESINVSYNLNSEEVLECYDSFQVPEATASWTYKNAVYSSNLSVVLKTNPRFEGKFADPQGNVLIDNSKGSRQMMVNCQYFNGKNR
jgi:hypothetical protein